MSRKTDYIISLEASTERVLTHFPVEKQGVSLSDRGKVNAARRASVESRLTRNAEGLQCNIYHPRENVPGKK